MTIRKQLMRSAMIGHHVKQDKISLKILKKIRSILRKFPLSSFLFFINYRTRYSRLFEASKGTSLFSIKVSIKGRWFGRNRAAERRLAAKSNPRWRVEKGRKKKSDGGDTRRRIVSRNSSPCRSISPLRGSPKNRFTIFCGKFRENE